MTDGIGIFACRNGDGAAVDGDRAAIAHKAAANACAVLAARGGDSAAGDGHRAAIATIVVMIAAANAGAVLATSSGDSATVDIRDATITTFTAADARAALFAARGIDGTAIDIDGVVLVAILAATYACGAAGCVG